MNLSSSLLVFDNGKMGKKMSLILIKWRKLKSKILIEWNLVGNIKCERKGN